MLKSNLADVILDLATEGGRGPYADESTEQSYDREPKAELESALYDYRRWLNCFGHVSSDQQQSFYQTAE